MRKFGSEIEPKESDVLTDIKSKDGARAKSSFFFNKTSEKRESEFENDCCKGYTKLCEQIGNKCGRIPLGPIAIFDVSSKYWDIMQIHRMNRQSGDPKCLGLRLSVATQLKVPTWRSYFANYFDRSCT